MNIKQLKSGLLIRLAVYFIIIVAAVLLVFYLEKTSTNIGQKKERLKNETRALSSKVQGFKQKTLEFSEAVDAWEQLSDEQSSLNGLRINDAKDLLDQFQVKYHLSDVSTSFSKPEQLADKFVSGTVVVISSNVNITFKGITDESMLQFVEALTNDFPGYIQIKSLSLTQIDDITLEVLKNIVQGENPGLVQGALDFLWKDLKYIGPEIKVKGQDEESNSSGGN